MKVKFKTKSVKARVPVKSSVAQKADELGDEYAASKEQLANMQGVVARTTEAIKSFAAAQGQRDGKATVVRGRRYAVGFLTKSSSPVINQERAKKLLSKAQFEVVRESVVSPALLIRAVKKGIISQQLFDKIIDQRPPQRVIHVKRI